MTAGIENFQVATPDAYAGSSQAWKRRLLAAQLLQQQAQTGDKVYGHGLGGMKLLASALGGWMEGKEEAKNRASALELEAASPFKVQTAPESSNTSSSSTSGGTSTTSGGTAASSPLDTQMRQTFMDTLKEKGLTNPYALAVADSFGQHESNWDPAKLDATWSDPSRSGQPGTSGGALSWRNDRLRNMADFVSKAGEKDPTRAQALFFLNENPDLIKRMQASKGLEDAHDNMSEAWKYDGYDRRGGGEYANRLATARARLAAYQGGQSPATASADEPATPDPRAAGQIASIAGTMAPSGAPKAAPVPGPSMAPPNLTSVATDSATGKPIPANAARLDTSAIDRAHPRPQAAPQPAAEAPPAPQQMAQAQTQAQPAQRATGPVAPKNESTEQEIRWAKLVLSRQAAYGDRTKQEMDMAQQVLMPTYSFTTTPSGQVLRQSPRRGDVSLAYEAPRKSEYKEIEDPSDGIKKPALWDPDKGTLSFVTPQGRENTPPAMGPDGKPIPPGIDRKDLRKKVTEDYATGVLPVDPKLTAELRKEVFQTKEYSNYAQAKPVFEGMKETAGRDNKASDLNLVYGLGKIMDPGSVVREGEIHMANDTQGIADRLNGLIRGINGGARLQPEVRAQILQEAHGRMKSYEDAYGQIHQHYSSIATDMRMKPEHVVPKFERSKPWEPPQKPEDEAKADGGTVTVQSPGDAQKLKPGTRYRNPAGQEFIR